MLYVGDHIYGDILRSKKETSWYTAMIIQELDSEVARTKRAPHDSAAQARARGATRASSRTSCASTRVASRSSRAHSGDGNGRPTPSALRVKRAVERIRAELRSNLAEYDVARRTHLLRIPPLLGLAPEGAERDVELRAAGRRSTRTSTCARVSCLGSYSPQQFFRSPYDLMPHEL